MNYTRRKITYMLLVVLLIASCLFSMSIGALNIPIKALLSIFGNALGFDFNSDYSIQQQAVLLNIRLPRMVLGVLVGATLSISGASIQGLFRNPLAEPGIIGISSGATLFAVLVIVLEGSVFGTLVQYLGYYTLALAAFVGALITTFVIYRFSVRQGRTDVTSLLLIGIAINALVMSFTGLLTYIASDEQLRNITFWSLGSLGGASWQTVSTLFPFSVISVGGLLFFSKSLNAMALGEAQAEHLGISVQQTKKYIIILAAIGVGATVAFTGLIGFIGLVIPHILRMSVTGDHKFLLPASAIFGAGILVLSDLIARTIASPTELPIGILTALFGVPIFLYIILKDRKSRKGL
ncbi:FecCD family ABC transporter permease [Sphingobacterium corticis]|uniref:FecCD family ABC transporter permease n=1 Tax=Sphingobacterium corticis TaxID=1812823 RepID=A0ABW5NGI5_9SPHI